MVSNWYLETHTPKKTSLTSLGANKQDKNKTGKRDSYFGEVNFAWIAHSFVPSILREKN